MRKIPVTFFAIIVGLCALTGPAMAATPSDTGPIIAAPVVKAPTGPAPDELLRAATLAVTANLNQNRNQQTGTPEQMAELVETILPLFDFNHMTRIAMARNWQLTSAQQRKSLIAEFQKLLVQTYSTALENYRGQAIAYKPMRMAPGETTVIVKSTMAHPGAEPMTIDYDMEHTSKGWMVYDIKFSGISLITTYRSTFDQIIRNGGVDGLIQTLSAKNRETEAAPKSQANSSRSLLFIYSLLQNTARGSR